MYHLLYNIHTGIVMLSTCIYYSPLFNGNYKLCTCHLSKNVMQHGQILVCTLCIVIVEHNYCGSSKYQGNNQYINAPLASSVVLSLTLMYSYFTKVMI